MESVGEQEYEPIAEIVELELYSVWLCTLAIQEKSGMLLDDKMYIEEAAYETCNPDDECA